MAEGKPPHPSFWIESTPRTDYPVLSGNVSVDVAVIGAGITGLTSATLLKRAGKTVALVDMKRIVRGATGYTTAKVTAGHGLIYSYLTSALGGETASTYAQANQAAVERVARFVDEDRIDCDFERKVNYVYAETRGEVSALEQEVDAARRCGLDVSLVQEPPLPFEVAAAIRLDRQAQFHPRKYLLALAETSPGDGSYVFELTRALAVEEGDPCVVKTDRGELRAGDVIVATHLPFLDRGFFFARTFPHRSYAVAAPIAAADAPDGMFINSGTPTRSVRTIRDGERLLLQVGGQGHKTGEAQDTPERYRQLERFLRENWPRAGEAEYRWSTQDYMSFDRLPYIGRLHPRSRHVSIATGFNKWGMSNGTVAAMILTDHILEERNDWSEVFSSTRLNVRASTPKLVKEWASLGFHFVADRLTPARDRSPEDLGNEEGAILRVNGRMRAVYRDEAGELHMLSPVCRHLRCIVAWNPAERTWDCPCHGSRYTGDGRVIQGPAIDHLEAR
jgi:glycine/D-amino acid oxidase-like deaminating enzyme/nitrite reductase/ring-hydroxylating ferredoxin subunit